MTGNREEKKNMCFRLMVGKLPENKEFGKREEYWIAIYEDGYESAVNHGMMETGNYRYDRMTGIYALDNGATLTENTRGYTYQSGDRKLKMIPYQASRELETALTGSTSVAVPGGYTLTLQFTLETYDDGSCALAQSINDTAFEGTWEKEQDGSYQFLFTELEVTESSFEEGVYSVAVKGNIRGIAFDVMLKGKENKMSLFRA